MKLGTGWSGSLLCLATLVAMTYVASVYAEGNELSRAEVLHNVVKNHFVPRVAAFARAAPRLVTTMESLCSAPGSDALKAARAEWTETMLAWESASAIAFGPLVARHSIFRIDFWPPRLPTIEKTLSAPPTTLKALESIGAPAKGLAALEWLLWTPLETPDLLADRTRCAYATLLARDIADEASMLNTQFVAFAATRLPDKAAENAFAGLLHLALNGLEVLGVRKMEKPAERANRRTFPRLLSEETAAAWNAQWLSIRNFLIGDGSGANDNLESFLRAHDLSAAADHMRNAVDRVTKTMQATHATPAEAIKAAKDIAALRTVLVEEVAAGLKIPVQFGENDGD